jgi:uncharacterized membrane protein YdjX (TVP38/TMEM64 family)
MPLVALGLAAATVFHVASRHGWSLQAFAEHHKELQKLVAEHHALAFACYLAVYVLVAALSLPGCVVLSAVGGLLFGWFVGALAAVAGATTGATLFFLLARTSLGDILSVRAESPVRWLRSGFQKDALSYILFLRLTPAFPFGAVNLAAAFMNVRLRDFVLGTFLGVIPAALVFSSAGAEVDRVLATQRRVHEQCVQSLLDAGLPPKTEDACAVTLTLADLVTKEALLLLAALGALALIPVLVKKLRKNLQSDA